MISMSFKEFSNKIFNLKVDTNILLFIPEELDIVILNSKITITEVRMIPGVTFVKVFRSIKKQGLVVFYAPKHDIDQFLQTRLQSQFQFSYNARIIYIVENFSSNMPKLYNLEIDF